MIFVYIGAIVTFCVVFALAVHLSEKKQKTTRENLMAEKPTIVQEPATTESIKDVKVEEPSKENNEIVFEDFSLEEDSAKAKTTKLENPFGSKSFVEEKEGESEDIEFEEFNKRFEAFKKKMNDYEREQKENEDFIYSPPPKPKVNPNFPDFMFDDKLDEEDWALNLFLFFFSYWKNPHIILWVGAYV